MRCPGRVPGAVAGGEAGRAHRADASAMGVLAVVSSLPLVLVVDDNPENLTVIGELLQPAHAVRAANGGARALRLAKLAPRPDLVLLDVMMPDMDGYDVLAGLRSDPETASIPVIFLTALNSPADEEHGLALGAVDYITKPIRPAVLLARVRTQLQLKAVREAERRQSQGLQAQLAQHLAELQRSHDVSLLALARLAQPHHPGMAAHLQRLQACLTLLAQHWPVAEGVPAMSAAELALLVRAAPLHDIGMASLPLALLARRGPLSDGEWQQVQGHTTAGAAALAEAEREAGPPIDLLQCAALLARHHHERWDGRGYPDGLAGEAIPLPARMLAVAEAFDALIAPGGPWPALSHPLARSVIADQRATQFDPRVVDAFVRAFDDISAAATRLGAPSDGGGMASTARLGARCSLALPVGVGVAAV